MFSLDRRFPFRIISRGTFGPNSVKTHLSTDYNSSFSAEELCSIDASWQMAAEKASSSSTNLFDGALYRLAGCKVEYGQQNSLHLKVGRTSYREFVGTRDPQLWGRFRSRANPIGTTVAVRSCDGWWPIIRRSPFVELDPDKFYFFGGYCEPDFDTNEYNGNLDVFRSALRELSEETLNLISNCELSCLGVFLDLINIHPELAFFSQLETDRSKLSGLVANEEVGEVIFVNDLDLEEFMNTQCAMCTAGMLGTISLLNKAGILCHSTRLLAPGNE